MKWVKGIHETPCSQTLPRKDNLLPDRREILLQSVIASRQLCICFGITMCEERRTMQLHCGTHAS